MNWQAIASGANGLCMYGYHSMYRNLKGDEFAAVWRDVCAAAAEVRKVEDVLLADDNPVNDLNSEDVVVRSWKHGRKVYYLIVNRNARDAKGRLRLPNRMDALAVKVGAGAWLSGDKCSIEYSFSSLGYAFVELTNRPWWKLWR